MLTSVIKDIILNKAMWGYVLNGNLWNNLEKNNIFFVLSTFNEDH